ncbi:MAG: hypothetical protein NC343_03205 [Muribaculum sp.]|nr:hypothetical protein [Muribaculaceae bacterium]MCM1080736.1 hypothetical protein [Muribaculum sp.]
MKTLLSIILSISALAATAQNDIYPDTWAGIDDLGRIMPSYDETPLKTDRQRTVGIFYVSWHADSYCNFLSPWCGDVTKILEQDNRARLNAIHQLWKYPLYHWGEPEMGYFLSRDRWVIRRDISMLSDAGVDVLILDATNAVTYFSEWETLFSVMTEMQSEGNVVPKVCFWVYNGDPVRTAEAIFTRYYNPGKYQHLWFYWEGKPLFLYNQYPTVNASSTTDYSARFKSFFTLRNMWWGYARANNQPYVGTEGNWSFGYDMHDTMVNTLTPAQRAAYHNGVAEQMCVTPAQHASTMVGKSWTVKNREPKLDRKDMPAATYVPWLDQTVEHPENYGIYFQERWDEALQVDPQFIYINDWNEWTAGKFDETSQFMGRSNPFLFVDQYNAEFNRTIQPALNAYTDNYYMQMVQNIRRYKGVRPAPSVENLSTISIDGSFADWDAVEATYRDTYGDNDHRDYNGYGGLHYTNTSGRNDIVLSKVAVTESSICFYAETAQPLTPHTGENWMLLFIDADSNPATGWHGYEYLVNKSVTTATTTTVMRRSGEEWVTAGSASLRYCGSKLEIELPFSSLSINPGEGAINFKWADNPLSTDHILDLCREGDTAPNRRFAYRFNWSTGTSSFDYPTVSPLKVSTLGCGMLNIVSSEPYSIFSPAGIMVAQSTSGASHNLNPGLYFIRCASGNKRVVVK